MTTIFINKFLFLTIMLSLLAGGIMGMAFFQYHINEYYDELQAGRPFYGRTYIRLTEEMDKREMFDVARDQVEKLSDEEAEFNLTLLKRTDNMARLEIVFGGEEGLGRGEIILEKVSEQWRMVDIGMDLSGWQEKAPELFPELLEDSDSLE